jgi:perosamine synthetase
MFKVPLAVPDLSGNEERNVVDAIRSSWISSTGAYVERFEREFAAFCGTRAAVGVCNGTAALHTALLAMGLKPRDEVLVPSLSYVATANAVRYAGATPVFADADPATGCLDPAKIADACSPRTRGLVAVHLYGHPADMDAIHAAATTAGLWVVEDAAQAHGAKYKGRPAGSLAPLAAFSFYGNKILTGGEGGAVTVDDPELERRVRLIRGQGMDPGRRYWFPIVGHNYRLTNVVCAMLCAQLERRDAILARRREVFAAYRRALEGVPGIGFPAAAPWAETAPWLFNIFVDAAAYGRTRDELAAFLAEAGIETRPFFIPLHTLPPYEKAARKRSGRLPVTDRLAATGLSLPTFNAMTGVQVAEVSDAIRRGKR